MQPAYQYEAPQQPKVTMGAHVQSQSQSQSRPQSASVPQSNVYLHDDVPSKLDTVMSKLNVLDDKIQNQQRLEQEELRHRRFAAHVLHIYIYILVDLSCPICLRATCSLEECT